MAGLAAGELGVRPQLRLFIKMIPSFDEQILRALAEVLGDTSAGLTGNEISQLLTACGIDDLSLSTTKRHRLYEALAARQERDGCANHVGHFVIQAMRPVRYLKNPEVFESRRLQINSVLAFAGLSVSKRGQLEPVDAASTIPEAQGPPPEVIRQSSETIGAETVDVVKQQSRLLLAMFDELARTEDHQKRGYFLQDLLNRLFVIHDIPVTRSFTRNQGAEQIDGAFSLDGWYYLVECRWREKVADTRQLDGLLGQVSRSGKQTMGLFLSVEGWSKHVPNMLKQNSHKCIVLMDGYDLRCVLAMEADLRELLVAKLACLNLETEPFFGMKSFLAQR